MRIVIIATYLLLALSAPLYSGRIGAQVSRPPPPQPNSVFVRPADIAELLRQTEDGSAIQILIHLRVSPEWIPEAELDRRQANQAVPVPTVRGELTRVASLPPRVEQALRIVATQERVLQALPDTSRHRHTIRFRVPAISIVADRSDIAELAKHPEVAFISAARELEPALSQSNVTLDSPAVHAQGLTGTGWNVAIVDTGIMSSHPFLQGRVVSEACFSSAVPDLWQSLCPSGTSPELGVGAGVNCDPSITACAHGTHVAGIVAGQIDCIPGWGECEGHGIAPGAGIIAIQVFHSVMQSGAIRASDVDIIQALEHVYQLRTTHNIAAVNLSLGSGLYDLYCDLLIPALTQAVENLVAAGIAVVASTGNLDSPVAIGYPACISSVTAVSGSAGDQVWRDSPGFGSNNNWMVDFLAPAARENGYGILSAFISYSGNPAYAHLAGTSAAAPHVSAALAILRQRYPSQPLTFVTGALRDGSSIIVDTRNGANGLLKRRPRLSGALDHRLPPYAPFDDMEWPW